MSLWVKRTGQLLLAALFLLACEEEASLLGFRNPTNKFDVRFVELPVETSVIWIDSLRTSNFYFSNEPNRLLTGQYIDPRFGSVKATSYTQFFTETAIKVDPATAEYDSASLELAFDFYSYGSASSSGQEIQIFQMMDDMDIDSSGYFFNKRSQTTGALLGSKAFSINPAAFESYLSSGKDTTIRITIPLDDTFGEDIFLTALAYATATDGDDSTYVRYDQFVDKYKGLAIKSVTGDKMVGFALDADTKLKIHYHQIDRDSVSLNFRLANVASFVQLETDRSASDISSVTAYHQDYNLPDNCYIQSGTGVLTTLDLSSFYAFRDTVPQMIVNSAELVITEVIEESDLTPPSNLFVRLLDDNRIKSYNRTRDAFRKEQDNLDLEKYNNQGRTLQLDNTVANFDSAFTVFADVNNYLQLTYNTSAKSYRGFMTLFAQEMSIPEERKTPFTSFVLYPRHIGKTVNRVVFPKDKVKLRVYYTVPTVTD